MSAHIFDGYMIIVDRHLDPRLERVRSRDLSCFNLSADARNRVKLAEASTVYVMHDKRLIVCPTHVKAQLEKQLAR